MFAVLYIYDRPVQIIGVQTMIYVHLQLARENGINFTEVIRNGQMLGVHDRRNARTVSTGSMNVLGEAQLTLLYNDGNKVSSR